MNSKNCLRELACAGTIGFGFDAQAWNTVTVNDYIKGGLVLHFDAEFNSTNAEGLVGHDAASTEWLDLSGNGQTATRTTDKPTLGENEQGGKYMNPNAVNGTFSGYSFTAAQATLDAVNAMPAHVTKEICAKAVTYATDMSFFGFRGAGGTFGSRGDGSCNVYFNYRGCGGGGRIAIRTSSTNGFMGTVTAYGGDNGYAYPNAATEGFVYWKIVGGLNIILR